MKSGNRICGACIYARSIGQEKGFFCVCDITRKEERDEKARQIRQQRKDRRAQ